MKNDSDIQEIARDIDAPSDALAALVVGLGTSPALGWLLENACELAEELRPRSLLELRAGERQKL
jgi:hypothetical protein